MWSVHFIQECKQEGGFATPYRTWDDVQFVGWESEVYFVEYVCFIRKFEFGWLVVYNDVTVGILFIIYNWKVNLFAVFE